MKPKSSGSVVHKLYGPRCLLTFFLTVLLSMGCGPQPDTQSKQPIGTEVTPLKPLPATSEQLSASLAGDLTAMLGETINVPGVADDVPRKLVVKVDKPSPELLKQLGNSDYWPAGKGIYEVSVAYEAPRPPEREQSGAQQMAEVLSKVFAVSPDVALASVSVTQLGLDKSGLLERKTVGYSLSQAQMPSLAAEYRPESAAVQLEFLSGQSRWWRSTSPRTRGISAGNTPCLMIDSRSVLSLLPKIDSQYQQTWCGYTSYSGLHFRLTQTAIHRHYPSTKFALVANKW